MLRHASSSGGGKVEHISSKHKVEGVLEPRQCVWESNAKLIVVSFTDSTHICMAGAFMHKG